MGNTQAVNKRYIDGARPVVDDISLTDENGHLLGKTTVTTDSTAGNLTLTSTQILGGLILRDPNGGARTDTLPTAALLAAAISNARRAEVMKAGLSFEFTVRNTASGANAITIAAGTGGSTSGTMTIAQNNSKRFLLVFTNVDAGDEAYTLYSLGTVVH